MTLKWLICSSWTLLWQSRLLRRAARLFNRMSTLSSTLTSKMGEKGYSVTVIRRGMPWMKAPSMFSTMLRWVLRRTTLKACHFHLSKKSMEWMQLMQMCLWAEWLFQSRLDCRMSKISNRSRSKSVLRRSSYFQTLLISEVEKWSSIWAKSWRTVRQAQHPQLRWARSGGGIRTRWCMSLSLRRIKYHLLGNNKKRNSGKMSQGLWSL